MKKTEKTALTAALFAAALNMAPTGSNAIDSNAANGSDQTPALTANTVITATTTMTVVYGPPVDTSTQTTLTEFRPADTTPAAVYGPPWWFTTEPAEESTTEFDVVTTTVKTQPAYGVLPIWTETTTVPVVTDYDPSTDEPQTDYGPIIAWPTDVPETTTTKYDPSTGLVQPTYGPMPYNMGDLNYDSRVDVFDFVLMKQAYLSGSYSYPAYDYDLNGDLSFGIADLLIMQRYLMGETKYLPDSSLSEEEAIEVVSRMTTETFAPLYAPPWILFPDEYPNPNDTTTTPVPAPHSNTADEEETESAEFNDVYADPEQLTTKEKHDA